MTIGLLKDIYEECPRGVRLLGMDIGKKTIGLALCDPDHGLATPLRTITRVKFTKDILLLAKVIDDYEVGGFVLGLPINMDGSEGPRAQSVRDFAVEMRNHPDIFGANPWIALHDERLSTAFADNLVDGSVSKRKAKEKGITDMLAAQVILQDALENMLTLSRARF